MIREERDDDRILDLLRAAGADLYNVPLTRTIPPRDMEPLRAAALRVTRYDWIVFTSARAVEALFEAMADVFPAGDSTLGAAGSGNPATGLPRLGAVGPATARAVRVRYGRDPDLVPERFEAACLAEALLARWHQDVARAERSRSASTAPLRILFPAAENARPELPDLLRQGGAEVDQVTAYVTEASPLPFARLLPPGGGGWHAVVFTSGTVVQIFFELCRRELGDGAARAWLASCTPVVLGASAEEALRRVGIAPAGRAARPTPEDLAAAILQLLGR